MRRSEHTVPIFSEWLKAQFDRSFTGESLSEISKRTGIGKSQLSLYLRGMGYPDKRSIEKLAATLQARPEDIWRMIPTDKGRDTPPPILQWPREAMDNLPPTFLLFSQELEALGYTAEEIEKATAAWLDYIHRHGWPIRRDDAQIASR